MKSYLHLPAVFAEHFEWWKFFIMGFIVFIGSQIVGVIPLIALVAGSSYMKNGTFEFSSGNLLDFDQHGVDPSLGLAALIFPFILGIVCFRLFTKPFHHTGFMTIINGRSKLRWGRFFSGAGLWAALFGLYFIGDLLMDPENYRFQFDAATFLPLIVVSLLLIPFQASFEEILFRGYFAQYMGKWTNNRWLAILVPGIVFGLMHSANPEVAEFGFALSMSQYILFGLFFGLVSVLDDGTEVAMGAHSANNIFLSLFVTFEASAIQTPALWSQQEVYPEKDLIVLGACCVLFVAVLGRRYDWKFRVLNQRIVDPEKELAGSADVIN